MNSAIIVQVLGVLQLLVRIVGQAQDEGDGATAPAVIILPSSGIRRPRRKFTVVNRDRTEDYNTERSFHPVLLISET